MPILAPGTLSPPRDVPPSIERPGYVGKPRPDRFTGSEVKDAETIVLLGGAGGPAAEILGILGAAVRPGMTTDDLDAIAHEECIKRGGYPSPLGYNGFPKSLCTSINEVICHGIPDSTVLKDGDIVNCDVTIFLGGVHGDTNATFLVGDVDEESRLLVERTLEALNRGIKAVKPGRRVSIIGRVIESYAKRFGYGVVRDFTGHGIGTHFHSGLVIPHFDSDHYDNPSARTELVPGMTFTIEPMITMGDWRHEMWDDDWTAVTADRSRTAQFEHTVLVTADGAEILTLG
jgi:methionyl aminopeptidase